MMRTILAACFVVGGVVVTLLLLGSTGLLEGLHSGVLGVVIILIVLGLIVAALLLFNRKPVRHLRARTAEERIHDLARAGLLESTSFRAIRAFGVEELDDEGLHYFVELADQRVLFLSGQYLYEYEPITDDPELNQPRRFPCSDFTVRRHRTNRFVVEIQCRGDVLEPELVAPPFTKRAWRSGDVPDDGTIIDTRGYESLRTEHVEAAAG